MARDLKSLAGGGSMSFVSEDIRPVDDVPVTFINIFEVSVEQRSTRASSGGATGRRSGVLRQGSDRAAATGGGHRGHPTNFRGIRGGGPAWQDGDAVGAPEDAGTAMAANPGSNEAANAGVNADGGEPKGGTTKAPRGR